MAAASSSPGVEVLWRPGCPFCRSLRRGLRRAGVAHVETNIWADPDAAARVRTATGGDETVPTVVVGATALVNPSVDQVIAAMQSQDPTYAPTPRTAPTRATGGPRPSATGLIWTVVVAVVWIALVAWRPTTTWHAAPLLMAAAWPWVAGQDLRPGRPGGRREVVLTGAAGLALTVLLAAVLSRADRFRGPTLTHAGHGVLAEAALLASAGAAAAVAWGLLRTVSRTGPALARVSDTVVARSDDVVMVEGNAYFPRADICDGVLQASSTKTVCPWKGLATYYDVHVDDVVLKDAAWTYAHPLPLARRVKQRVAFWNGVEVDLDPDP